MLKATNKKDIFIHLGIIAGISIVLVLLFFYIYLPITTNHGETIKVPDLKGKTLEQADDLLSNSHLRYQVNDSSYVAGAVPFSVLSQHPLPGSEVKANRKIYVTVTAKNPPMVPMPELKDKSLKAAEMELKSRDLVLASTRPVPSPFANLVIKQYVKGEEIAAGTHIPKGTSVTLDIGNGAMTSEIELPNVIGMNIDDAKALLTEQGLLIGLEKREQVSGKDKDQVIKQKPEYKLGAKIHMGESVDLWYAE
ncbi:MAG TPA: PASTA domain-containing protein [Cytophagaceae bacterium]|nr:PASTA domain-containing protein [Cytophagaceae bacterium]